MKKITLLLVICLQWMLIDGKSSKSNKDDPPYDITLFVHLWDTNTDRPGVPDYDALKLAMGNCRTPEDMVPKMLAHMGLSGVNMSTVQEAPYTMHDTDQYRFMPVKDLVPWRLVMVGVNDHLDVVDEKVEVSGWIMKIKEDIATTKKGTGFRLGVYRFELYGTEHCVEEKGFKYHVGPWTLFNPIEQDLFHDTWGKGYSQGSFSRIVGKRVILAINFVFHSNVTIVKKNDD